MKRFSALAAIVALFLLFAAPAMAQFPSNQNAGTAGGTANAIVLTVPNWNANLVNVPIFFIPASANTGATTLIVNSVGVATAVQKTTNNGLAALSGGEFRAGQTASVRWDGTRWVVNQPLGQYVQSSSLATSAFNFGLATNLQLNATVSTNALTIAVKTSAGADATADTPVSIPFRDSTIANGSPKIVSVAGALSFTIASGSTMGCVSATTCRLWIVAICSSGLSCTGSAGTDVVGLCAFNATSGTTIAPIDEAALQTSQSGTSGGNNAQQYYCNISAVTARAIRILGYVEITETVAGTWATGPTYTQLFSAGIKRPGDVVREVFVSSTTSASTSTTYASSNTLPTTANGALAVSSGALTFSSQANHVRIETFVMGGSSVNASMYTAYVANGSTVIAVSGQFGGTISASQLFTSIPVIYQARVPTSPATFNAYLIGSGTGTHSTNAGGGTSSAIFGGLPLSNMRVLEIMGALPEPANDNGEVRMVG